jgi:5-oxoprolinase (ATP-hydrolysing) subunit A
MLCEATGHSGWIARVGGRLLPHAWAVGRTTISPMSTPGGCSIAKAIARATASGGIAMTSRRCSSSARTAGSVTDSAKFVDVIPGETIVTRRASSCAVASPIPLLAPVIAITLPLIVTGQKLRAQPRLKLAIVASIDLNAGLGEGFGVWWLGDDDAMLGIVTSANVACGFHADYPAGLLRVCRLAAERGVRIGAQVSYPDMARFGRRFIDVTPEDLLADVVYQIGALHGLAQAAGSTVSYVKPHGALYNTIVTNREQAAAVAQAVQLVDANLPVLGLASSVFFEEAHQRGLRTVPEAFADRAYQPDGRLVARRHPARCCTIRSPSPNGWSPW